MNGGGSSPLRQTERASFSLAPPHARRAGTLTSAASFVFGALTADRDLLARVADAHLVRFDIEFPNLIVRFNIWGKDLANKIKVAYEPRSATDRLAANADLVVDAWDEAATGVACSAVPLEAELDVFGKVMWAGNGRFVNYQRPGSVSWLDLGKGHLIAWFRRADGMYLDERAKPFHKLIALALRERGVTLVHGAVVGRGDHGLLLTGKGGSGKSTTALAAAAAGFAFLGDDFVAHEATSEPEGHVAHEMFATALLSTEHLDRFPALRARAQAPHHRHEFKSMLVVDRPTGISLRMQIRLSAIVLPVVRGRGAHEIRRATPVEALLALAPSTLLMMPRPTVAVFERLADLARAIPAYRLDLGPDIASVPAALDEILRRAAVEGS